MLPLDWFEFFFMFFHLVVEDPGRQNLALWLTEKILYPRWHLRERLNHTGSTSRAHPPLQAHPWAGLSWCPVLSAAVVYCGAGSEQKWTLQELTSQMDQCQGRVRAETQKSWIMSGILQSCHCFSHHTFLTLSQPHGAFCTCQWLIWKHRGWTGWALGITVIPEHVCKSSAFSDHEKVEE